MPGPGSVETPGAQELAGRALYQGRASHEEVGDITLVSDASLRSKLLEPASFRAWSNELPVGIQINTTGTLNPESTSCG